MFCTQCLVVSASCVFVVCVLFKLCSYGDADAPRVDVGAVVPYVGVQNNYRMQEEQGYACYSWSIWVYTGTCI